jgi:hypothetical protein
LRYPDVYTNDPYANAKPLAQRISDCAEDNQALHEQRLPNTDAVETGITTVDPHAINQSTSEQLSLMAALFDAKNLMVK